jgi:hypothetical protein
MADHAWKQLGIHRQQAPGAKRPPASELVIKTGLTKGFRLGPLMLYFSPLTANSCPLVRFLCGIATIVLILGIR